MTSNISNTVKKNCICILEFELYLLETVFDPKPGIEQLLQVYANFYFRRFLQVLYYIHCT